VTSHYPDAEDESILSIFSREEVVAMEKYDEQKKRSTIYSSYMNSNKLDSKTPYLFKCGSPRPNSNVLRKAVNFADNQKIAWPVQAMNLENIYEEKLSSTSSSVEGFPVSELVYKKLRLGPGRPVQPSTTPPKQLLSATKYIESFPRVNSRRDIY